MKQAQSETAEYRSANSWWLRSSPAPGRWQRTDKPTASSLREMERSYSWSIGRVFLALLQAAWLLLILPFRLVFWVIAWLGRITAIVLGFSLMVVGMALWAG